jgi:cobyrinic acid a,c-diamide synthase
MYECIISKNLRPIANVERHGFSADLSRDPRAALPGGGRRRGGGAQERDGIVVKNLLASYTHLRAAGHCDWPARFVGFVRRNAR